MSIVEDRYSDVNWANELRKAYLTAVMSPDPSSQNGALVYNEHRHLIGQGFNGFTPGVEITPDKLERPVKYLYIEHAERAAVYDCIGSSRYDRVPQGNEPVLMVCPWASCADCARAIVLSGISLLVRHKDAMERKVDRWADSIALADKILIAGGVEIYEHVGPVDGPEIMHLEEKWTP